MKFIPSGTASALSGSTGGTTASRNRFGQYFRRRAVPVNPSTTRQAVVRNSFSSLVALWANSLTPAQREAWTIWAANTPTTDALGQSITLTGQQAFIGANTPRLQVGLPVISPAPTVFNNGVAPTLADVSDPGPPPEIEVTLPSQPGTAGTMVLWQGPPQSPAVTFYKGPYRFAGTAAITATQTQVTVTSNDPWGPTATGQRIPVRCRVLYNDGRLSTPFETILTV
jgi:hypothetical protein